MRAAHTSRCASPPLPKLSRSTPCRLYCASTSLCRLGSSPYPGRESSQPTWICVASSYEPTCSSEAWSVEGGASALSDAPSLPCPRPHEPPCSAVVELLTAPLPPSSPYRGRSAKKSTLRATCPERLPGPRWMSVGSAMRVSPTRGAHGPIGRITAIMASGSSSREKAAYAAHVKSVFSRRARWAAASAGASAARHDLGTISGSAGPRGRRTSVVWAHVSGASM